MGAIYLSFFFFFFFFELFLFELSGRIFVGIKGGFSIQVCLLIDIAYVPIDVVYVLIDVVYVLIELLVYVLIEVGCNRSSTCSNRIISIRFNRNWMRSNRISIRFGRRIRSERIKTFQ